MFLGSFTTSLVALLTDEANEKQWLHHHRGCTTMIAGSGRDVLEVDVDAALSLSFFQDTEV